MELGLRPRDRILVLGSSGWFGQELNFMLDKDVHCMRVPGPSSRREISFEEIKDFAPTLVVNFAFLPRQHVLAYGDASFSNTVESLIERFIRASELPSVRGAATFSSGTAVTDHTGVHGKMKREEEERALALASANRCIVVARTYSVSGPFVRKPSEFVFSDFILQAATGEIHISSSEPVYRRFSAVQDVIGVALRALSIKRSGLFESGGPLVEVGELAEAVRDSISPRAQILRRWDPSATPQHYHSDNCSWQEWTAAVSLRPADLKDQIVTTARGLHIMHT